MLSRRKAQFSVLLSRLSAGSMAARQDASISDENSDDSD